jgi:uncharacterized membrane protein HdeD (DUF308 family)
MIWLRCIAVDACRGWNLNFKRRELAASTQTGFNNVEVVLNTLFVMFPLSRSEKALGRNAMTSTQAQPSPPLPPIGLGLLRALSEYWWLLLLRGIAAIAFGILAMIWPGLTLLTLIFLWGAYAIVDGVLAVWEAVAGRAGEIAPRWWLAVVGIAGIVAGLLTFAWPGVTALVLLVFIATWAIVIGALQIWGAIRLRKEIEGEWLLILSGLLSVAFGIALIVQPGTGALALVWLIAWFAILAGCIYIALAFRLKKYPG